MRRLTERAQFFVYYRLARLMEAQDCAETERVASSEQGLKGAYCLGGALSVVWIVVQLVPFVGVNQALLPVGSQSSELFGVLPFLAASDYSGEDGLNEQKDVTNANY